MHYSEKKNRIFPLNSHNIEFNFFDDDLSLINIHSDGWPPVPTISMLKDIKNNYIKSKQLSWVSRNRNGTAYLDSFSKTKCIENVKFHHYFSNLPKPPVAFFMDLAYASI